MSRRHAARAAAALTVVAAGLAAAPAAWAQSTASGWALNRYEPSPVGDAFFLAEHPWYRETRLVAAGLTLDYAVDPLSVVVTRAGQAPETRPVVAGMFTGHLGVAVAPLAWLSLHASLPVAFAQSGEASPIGVGPAAGVAIGDLRAGVRVRILGHADRSPFSLHLGAVVFVPTGSAESNTGDGSVRVEPRLVMAGRASVLRWSVGAALQLRSNVTALNLAVGNELRFTAALGVALLQDRLHVGPEAYVFTSLGDLPGGGGAAFAVKQWGAEALVGARYLIADTVQVGLAGGLGMQEGYGVPAARGIFSVAYAPVTRVTAPRDGDRDGVIDADDVCPTTPQGEHPDAARRGCPVVDRDGDGVDDTDDQCVDVAQGDHPDPARRGCPVVDRDGDGVNDTDDQCVDVAQGDHPDAARPGCPQGDRDADGVLDGADQCVDVAAGPRPSATRAGCPAPDNDHDNLIDQPEGPDRCPEQPETFNGVEDDDGCPDGAVLAEVSGGQVRILQSVNFRSDRDQIIGAQSFQVLNSVVAILRASPQLRVDVQGHTDDVGTTEHNLDLAQRRAAAVRAYLTAHEVAEARLEAHGFGTTCPAMVGTSLRARSANRRVQFMIISAETPAGVCANAQR
jgi:outer membrane protein OmpA-like peptidoglycan-associated protein